MVVNAQNYIPTAISSYLISERRMNLSQVQDLMDLGTIVGSETIIDSAYGDKTSWIIVIYHYRGLPLLSLIPLVIS